MRRALVACGVAFAAAFAAADGPGAGAQLQLQYCASPPTAAQAFTIVGGVLANVPSGLLATYTGDNDAPLQLQTATGGPAQAWTFNQSDGAFYGVDAAGASSRFNTRGDGFAAPGSIVAVWPVSEPAGFNEVRGANQQLQSLCA